MTLGLLLQHAKSYYVKQPYLLTDPRNLPQKICLGFVVGRAILPWGIIYAKDVFIIVSIFVIFFPWGK